MHGELSKGKNTTALKSTILAPEYFDTNSKAHIFSLEMSTMF